MLLILTSDKDLTADFLIVRLIEQKLSYFRLNAEELVDSDYEYTSFGERTVTTAAGRELDLNLVTAVWYRRAIYPLISSALTGPERFFLSGELRHLVFGMVWNPEIRWVNPIEKVYVAEHKLYQLRIAQQLGMPIPKTMATSSWKDAAEFVRQTPQGSICKPIFHGLYNDGSDNYSIYTRNVQVADFTDSAALGCPILLQEQVPRMQDLRVTFIGPKCFAAAIETKANTIDWRTPSAEARFSEITISDDLRHKCEQMLQTLGLEYGAFDFIRTPKGEDVFLEVNPTGEWAWLETSLGFPMRDAFVELFYGH